MNYETFCGGIFETNCYLVEAPEGLILFDAPEGACEWLEQRHVDLKLLLLTHGHIDHVQDVAKIKRRFNCPRFLSPLRVRARNRARSARFPHRGNVGQKIPRARNGSARGAWPLPR
jgi:glyoxylase-like metal-dependent hydrolase (beta-lactamase superfamily II)